MRGNKRLVQGIAVATMTGALVFTALPQQTIIKTEETVQITQNASAGTSAMSDGYMSQIFTQAMNPEKTDATPAMSTAVVGKTFIEKPAVIEHTDTEKKDTAKETDNIEKSTEKETKKKSEKKSKESSGQKQVADSTSEKKSKSAQVADSKENKTSSEADAQNVKASNTDKEKTESKKNIQKENKKENQKENQKDSQKKNQEEKKADKKSSAKEKWENKLMADVDKSLNIRKSDNIDSEVVGKLRKGDTATILKKGKKWTKIKSGDVTGFVKNSYCVYGTDAYKLAKKICHTYATVKTDGLRIRKKAHDDAIILRAAEEGDKLVVDKEKKEKDGWVAVTVDDTKGYVSSDYVDVALGTGKAITIEEEQAQIAAQQKAAAQQAASSSSSVSSSTANSVAATQATSTATQVSTNDLTLLSAIIFCEAGGESYAGQVAVGAVVMNRLKSGSFPNTISGVVYQSGQFSPVADGALARALSNGNYRYCTSAAQAALAGSDNTGGAKFFHRVNGDAGLVIGNHVFY